MGKNSTEYQKKAIIICQGLYPNETCTLQFLEEFQNRIANTHSKEELFLLKYYDIYIFPFINIDGIIFGNCQTNLAGNSLIDRNQISKHTNPELFYLLKEIKNISLRQEILAFCSLRSSIQSKSHFITTLENKGLFKFSLELPLLFSDLCSQFDLNDCQVVDSDQDKLHLLERVHNLTECQNLFEFFISSHTNGKGYQFSDQDYRNLGKDFLNSLAIFCTQKKNLPQINIKNKEDRKNTPKFNWKHISNKKGKFEIKKLQRSVSLAQETLLSQNDDFSMSRQDSQKQDLNFLKYLFSNKQQIPTSVKQTSLIRTRKYKYQQKQEEKRKLSLERKNKLLKQRLYKIKHNRSELTKGYNYVLRRKMENFIVKKKDNQTENEPINIQDLNIQKQTPGNLKYIKMNTLQFSLGSQ